MVLELIIIGGAIYYFVKKNKQNKARKAAWAAGQPWLHKDGSITYPPNYPGLPAYSASGYKQQKPVQDQQEYYSDAPIVDRMDEKAPLIVETRELVAPMGEKR